MKKCPFCAEEIQDEAIKCKHCREFLDPALRPVATELGTPWYFSTSFLVVTFLCVGPLVLPFIWWRPRMSGYLKFGLTALILSLTWLFYELTMRSLGNLDEYIKLLNQQM